MIEFTQTPILNVETNISLDHKMSKNDYGNLALGRDNSTT